MNKYKYGCKCPVLLFVHWGFKTPTVSLVKSAVSSENCLLSFITMSLVYDRLSLAFTSLSKSSWYGLTRPKATFRQIKTYFASCLLGWILLVLVGIVPWCSWSALKWKKQKNTVIFTKICYWKPLADLFFSLSCRMRTAQEGLILRDSWKQREGKRRKKIEKDIESWCTLVDFRTLRWQRTTETFSWRENIREVFAAWQLAW